MRSRVNFILGMKEFELAAVDIPYYESVTGARASSLATGARLGNLKKMGRKQVLEWVKKKITESLERSGVSAAAVAQLMEQSRINAAENERVVREGRALLENRVRGQKETRAMAEQRRFLLQAYPDLRRSFDSPLQAATPPGPAPPATKKNAAVANAYHVLEGGKKVKRPLRSPSPSTGRSRYMFEGKIFYARPKGARRKGMEWNVERGVYEPTV